MKLYFMPVWGDSAETIYDTMRQQTPGQTGKWGSLEATLDISEADVYLIQDYTDAAIPDHSKVCYFAREVPGAGRVDFIPGVQRYSWIDSTSYLYTKWVYPQDSIGGVRLTYDFLQGEECPEKKKSLICIQSDKQFLVGHKKRIKFLKSFASQYPYEIDLSGKARQLLGFKGGGEDYVVDKYATLKEYKYCMAFDNGQYKNYFGTQFTDAILAWTVPVYWGSPNIDEFFPEDSYISFDASNLTEVHRLASLLKYDDYERRLPALKEARDLILNKYNIWPTVHEAVSTNRVTWGGKK